VPASFRRPLAVAAIVAVALLLRLALVPLKGFAPDVAVFDSWARVLAAHGPLAIYGPNVVPRVDYTPGYLYVLWVVGLVRAVIDPQFTHPLAFRALLKIPNIVADFEAAALGFTIVRRFASPWRAIAVLAVLLVGPVFWIDSAYWGQADTIAAAFVLGAILLRLRDRASLAWLVLALGIIVKPQGAVLVPLFAVRFFMRGGSAWTVARASLAIAGIAYLVTLPFTTERSPLGVLGFFLGRYVNGVAKAPHASEGAFNLFTILGPFFTSDSVRFLGIPLHAWSLVLLLSALGAIAWWYARTLQRTNDSATVDRAFVYAAALSLAALFFLGTRMHERYLLPGLACASLVAFESLDTTAAVAALTVSFVANVAVIVAGFTGGAHHPQVVLAGHALSALNLIALVVLARAYVARSRASAA